jgi:hypothetical protein
MTQRLLFAALLISFIAIPRTGSAQIAEYEVGVKAGINYSDIQASDLGGDGRRRAYVFGGFAEADFTGPFAAQVELLYSQKGDETNIGSGAAASRFKLKLNYIEVPVLVKLQGPLLGNAEANFYAGPAIGFKVSESVEGLAANTQIGGTLATPIDVGVAFGIEFGFALGEGRFIIDLRFTPGFSEIRDDAILQAGTDSYEIPDPDASNSTLSAMIGLSL